MENTHPLTGQTLDRPRRTESYRTEIVKIQSLGKSTLLDMCRLYLAHYDGSDEMTFRADLEAKSEALLVYQQQQLVGFTLYEVYRRDWQDRPINIIYSGDTVVDRAHWGQQALAFAWIARAGQIKRLEPAVPFYWFLIVKGHRTYRYLPTFSRAFHPHWSRTDEQLKAIADRLAKAKFPDSYDQDSGVIRFPQSRGHLKSCYAHPTRRERQKPAVRFFLQRNPGYLQGHELVCLCELSEQNLKPLARRLFLGRGK